MFNDEDEQQNIIINNTNTSNNKVPYCFSLDRIEKSNCNLCNCDYRCEAEELFDNQKRKNYSEIKRQLKEKYNFDATVSGIKNHMMYHYKIIQNNAALQEYADDVQKWVNMQTNKVGSLKTKIAVLDKEIFMIAQSSEDLDVIERRKSAETIKKLIETVLVCEKRLSEYGEEAKPINLVFNQLQIIVNDELAHIDSVKTKKVVSSILSRLKESVGDIIIE